MSNFKRRLDEYDARHGPCKYNMSIEEYEDLERRRAKLPERFKNESEAVQDMFIIRGVDLVGVNNEFNDS